MWSTSTAWSRSLSLPRRRDKRTRCKAQQTGQSGLSTGVEKGILKSMLISSCFCAVGDLISQTFSVFMSKGEHRLDFMRLMRMGAFGLVFYGPLQHFWYRSLDQRFPTKSIQDFLPKVVLNQIVLGPVVVAASFSWAMILTGQMGGIPRKFEEQFLTTMINGWKIWVPAAAANFACIPVESQVLFMSTVSVCWATYLGYETNKQLTHPMAAVDATD